jgi:preprotein translocase subunit SecA
MLDYIFKKILGDKSKKDLRILQPYVDKINAIYPALSQLSHQDLRAKTAEFKNRIAQALQKENLHKQNLLEKATQTEDSQLKEKYFKEADLAQKQIDSKTEEVLLEILPEAFAVIRETARRFSENDTLEVEATEADKALSLQNKSYLKVIGNKALWQTTWEAGGNRIKWNMVHYDVQLIGGTALHQGKIAEMQTGEGKTLVATLPVYLNALTGRGVHIVTVNDYLAKRDAQWMSPLYQFHGLTVDCIELHSPGSEARRNAYRADITFGTNNEFGFDYLRDNMAHQADSLVQRGHFFAIVDEVDSVLIDEARTPLIISGPVEGGDKQQYDQLKDKIENVVRIQQKAVNSFLTNAKKLHKESQTRKLSKEEQEEFGLCLLRCHRGLPRNKAFIKFLSESGVKALLQKTENLYMQDNSREMPKADAEVYFVLNEKNNAIELTEKGIELMSSDTDPDFFILPNWGVTLSEVDKNEALTADEKIQHKEQIISDFKIKSERIHTLNQLLKAYTLFEKDQEYVVMNGKVLIVDEQTGRIMDGRRYSDGLHQAIEAKENVKIEAATQTYASITLQNYFRMYHKLAGMTGTARTEAGEFWQIYKLDVVAIPTNRVVKRQDANDKVYKTMREKFNAVILQIEEARNAGRAILVGTTSVEISELLSRMLKQRQIPHNVLNAKQHAKEAEIVAQAGQKGVVTIATNMAGRGTDIKLSEEVKQAGGLMILGTERHESRRIDLQLRGRSGRQGDPGSSVFFVSLEDDLMRMFGSERIARIMDAMGIEEGEVIEHSMVTNSIARAQKKVEENNFGTRKRLLEYDDVMNAQRKIVYAQRYHALMGERLELDLLRMQEQVVAQLVSQLKINSNYEDFVYLHKKYLGFSTDMNAQQAKIMPEKELKQGLLEKARVFAKEKREELATAVLQVMQEIGKQEASKNYKNVVLPFVSGEKGMQIPVDITEATASQGLLAVQSLEKSVVMASIDQQWKEHLRRMDDLRHSVQMAVHQQKDPLLVYKFEAFELFQNMLNLLQYDVLGFLNHAKIPPISLK